MYTTEWQHAFAIAASVILALAIRFLLSFGAIAGASNLDEDTPMKYPKKAIHNQNDFSVAFGFLRSPPREIDIVPKYDCITAS